MGGWAGGQKQREARHSWGEVYLVPAHEHRLGSWPMPRQEAESAVGKAEEGGCPGTVGPSSSHFCSVASH